MTAPRTILDYARCRVVLDALVVRHWLIDHPPAVLRLAVLDEISSSTKTQIEIAESIGEPVG